jgi:hypothetical protein
MVFVVIGLGLLLVTHLLAVISIAVFSCNFLSAVTSRFSCNVLTAIRVDILVKR